MLNATIVTRNGALKYYVIRGKEKDRNNDKCSDPASVVDNGSDSSADTLPIITNNFC